MKTILLSFAFVCVSIIAHSQLPCVKYYSVMNLGGGNCQTAGTGSNKYYPGYLSQSANQNYLPTGKFVLYFDGAIPAGTAAPEILTVVPDNSTLAASSNFDYKYAAFQDNISAARTSVTYCYYGSASNQNIFNGAKEPLLIFTIKYNAVNQQCGGVTEAPSTLPVNFKSFDAARDGQNVLLKWTTVSEQNNFGFEVQVKKGNNDWKIAGFVPSKEKSGNSSSELNYQFVDVNADKEISIYRVKQIDFGGSGSYSNSRLVKADGQLFKELSVYPNPSKGNLFVTLPNENIAHDLQIVDASGRMIRQLLSVKNNININNLKPGHYLVLAVNKSDNSKTSVKIFVQ